MKNVCLIFLLTIAGFLTGFSQHSVNGEIIDSKTGEGIPYVNIGIPSKVKGTVSNEAGKFKLSYADKNDEVVISAIGYATISLKIELLLKKKTINQIYTLLELLLINMIIGQNLILHLEILGQRLHLLRIVRFLDK